MREVWSANFSCYGATRLWAELNRQQYRIARCTVERLMPVAGIVGVQYAKRLRTTIPDEAAPRPADLVQREFRAERPNDLWVADIERHEALTNRAVVKGHRRVLVAASASKLRAA